MTTELEKEFFLIFDIKPKYQDTCTVEEKYWQNEEIANEFGTFDQYMNIKCGNQENCTTQCSCAYQKEIYPQITDRHYLELICILTRNCYQIEICNALTYQGINEFTINLIKEPTRYHSHSEDFKIALLKAIKMISDDEDIKTEVQAIFEGE